MGTGRDPFKSALQEFSVPFPFFLQTQWIPNGKSTSQLEQNCSVYLKVLAIPFSFFSFVQWYCSNACTPSYRFTSTHAPGSCFASNSLLYMFAVRRSCTLWMVASSSYIYDPRTFVSVVLRGQKIEGKKRV